jgi:hypothetical protein
MWFGPAQQLVHRSTVASTTSRAGGRERELVAGQLEERERAAALADDSHDGRCGWVVSVRIDGVVGHR